MLDHEDVGHVGDDDYLRAPRDDADDGPSCLQDNAENYDNDDNDNQCRSLNINSPRGLSSR